MKFLSTVVPRVIARGHYYFFHTKREWLFEGRHLFKGDNYFKYSSLEVVPLIVRFIFPLNEKIITSNKLDMGFLSVPNLVYATDINIIKEIKGDVKNQP